LRRAFRLAGSGWNAVSVSGNHDLDGRGEGESGGDQRNEQGGSLGHDISPEFKLIW
jgi:hypothetical protein